MRRMVLAAAAVNLLWFAAPGRAGVLYSTGFEAPTFTTGPINGQGGWTQDIGASSAITIQTAVVKSGSQAMEINPAGQPGYTRTYNYTPYDTAEAGHDKYVVSSADVLLSSEGTLGQFNLAAFNIHGDSLGEVALLGSEVYVVTGNGSADTGVAVSLNAWHHFQIELDFTQNVFNTYLDGALIASAQPFVFSDSAVFRATAFETVPKDTATAPMYVDNYQVTTSATPMVPEPSSVVLAGLGGLFGLSCRLLRRRAAVA